MEITRYDHIYVGFDGFDMEHSPDGDWVRYEDIEHLLTDKSAELEELFRRFERCGISLSMFRDQIRAMFNQKPTGKGVRG